MEELDECRFSPKALEDFKLALQEYPNFADVYALIGTIYEKQGQPADALDAYETYIGLSGSNADPEIMAAIQQIRINQSSD